MRLGRTRVHCRRPSRTPPSSYCCELLSHGLVSVSVTVCSCSATHLAIILSNLCQIRTVIPCDDVPYALTGCAPLCMCCTGAGSFSHFLYVCSSHFCRYGLCDITKHVAKELQAPLFTPVSQAVSRRVAYHTFAHVLGLDIRFHLDRRTGRLSRILERGGNLLFSALVVLVSFSYETRQTRTWQTHHK